MNRRNFISSMVAAPIVTAPLTVFGQARGQRGPAAPAAAPQAAPQTPPVKRVPIRQSVMSSVWGSQSGLPIEEKCKILQRIGFKGMDLPTAQQIPVLKQYGLAPTMMTLQTGTSFTAGLIRKELHDMIEMQTKA